MEFEKRLNGTKIKSVIRINEKKFQNISGVLQSLVGLSVGKLTDRPLIEPTKL